jgi:phosphomevalonate kinase
MKKTGTSTSLEFYLISGLGSSACLVTSLVASLVSFFNAIQIPTKTAPTDPAALNYVHNLAQFCHCLAQGKIGSGFDVSSATYGSHRYVRFSKEVLEPLLKDNKVRKFQEKY